MLGLLVLLLSQLRHAGAHDPVRVTATRGGLSGNAHSPRLEVRLCADHPLLGSRAAAAAAETTAEPCAGLNLALCAVRTGSDSQTKGCRPAFEPPRLTVFLPCLFQHLEILRHRFLHLSSRGERGETTSWQATHTLQPASHSWAALRLLATPHAARVRVPTDPIPAPQGCGAHHGRDI